MKMKAFKNSNMKNMKSTVVFSFLVVLAFSCTRDEEALPLATFPDTPEIFTDNPVGLTDQFFRSFDPSVGANTDGFGTDENEFFEGTASIRIDVPGENDDNGTFIGGIFEDRGEGRDLTGYDALTFWAKGTVTATISLVGFGTDFEENRYATGLPNLELTTGWKKYIIPIPDPSKLTQEKGLFIFSAGTLSTGGVGYTFWIDELKFEKLGTLAQPRPAILTGLDIEQEGFLDVPLQLVAFTQTFHSATDGDITVGISPNYFDFRTSDPSVATVNDLGLVNVVGLGEVEITASLASVAASGSLTLDVQGGFDFAPEPTLDPAAVVSIFSDAYTNIPVSRYNSFFEPFQTTLGGVVPIGNQEIISYTNLNFVGIVFNDVIFPSEAVPPVDARNLTHLHVDINVQEALDAADFLEIELTNYGSTNTASRVRINANELEAGVWRGFDIELDDFTGLAGRERIGLLLFDSGGSISDILLDNIYFYTDTE